MTMLDVAASAQATSQTVDLGRMLAPVLVRWTSVATASLVGGVLALGVSYLVKPTFVSTTTLLPPQQQQSSANAALASLGALAGLAGGGIKTPGDQYVALMQSVTIQDRIIDKFDLMAVYDKELRQDARLRLANSVQVSLGKKDGIISLSVEDTDSRRAAEMAAQFVEELRWLTGTLAVTEAQQRRVFFERQWQQAKVKLVEAQTALEKSGFNGSALKAEPKSAAEAYGRLRAELAAAEIKLRTMRTTLTDGSPEVLQLTTTVQSLRQRLADQEASRPNASSNDADYVSRYREFKYQETMFELMAKQYELARVDESREGGLIQVVDAAQPAERKSKPKRSAFVLAGGFLGVVFSSSLILWRARRQSA